MRLVLDNLKIELENQQEIRDFVPQNNTSAIIGELGQLEDILENHNIETLEALDELLCYVKKVKDIEEELGIDLITLFKALKNGIWSKGGYYSDKLEKEPHFIERPEIRLCSYYDEVDENYNTILSDKDVMCIYIYDYEIMVRQTRLKDYGKTWALVKEDLTK